jgi:hypothetical protein
MDDDASVEQHQVRMVIDELSTDECWRHLAQVPTGRLCFVEDGEPMVLPFNHALDGHSIVLRTAGGTALHRLASASRAKDGASSCVATWRRSPMTGSGPMWHGWACTRGPRADGTTTCDSGPGR